MARGHWFSNSRRSTFYVVLLLLCVGTPSLAAVINPIKRHLGVDPLAEKRLEGDLDLDTDVDLDDFFLLADSFGSQLGEPKFDRRIDLVENDVIDLEDFFVLTDKYGQVEEEVPTELGGGEDQPAVGRSFFQRREGVETSALGDMDQDEDVDLDDFFLFADGFGRRLGEPGYNPLGDLSGDGVVNFDDYAIYIINFHWVAPIQLPDFVNDPPTSEAGAQGQGPIAGVLGTFPVFDFSQKFPFSLPLPGVGAPPLGSTSPASAPSSSGGTGTGANGNSPLSIVTSESTNSVIGEAIDVIADQNLDYSLEAPAVESAVPEPSTVLLLLTGLLGLGGYRRLRSK